MNIFVVGTGRCGTLTFHEACKHFTNYTTGYETGIKKHYNFEYPENHIEVDHRLIFFLDLIDVRYPDAHYIHLFRCPEEQIPSMVRKNRIWLQWYMELFARRPRELRNEPINDTEASYWAKQYYEAAFAMTSEFLTHRPGRAMSIDINMAKVGFQTFADHIGAEGDLAAAIDTFDTRYHAWNK